VCRLNRIVQIDCDLARIKHPVARLKKLVRADDAHRHDRRAKALCKPENALMETLHVPVACPRTLGERDQADAGIKRFLCLAGHAFYSFAAARVRHGNISKAPHHPAIDRNFKVRFQLEAAHELRNRGINHEGIENVHVIADEDARPFRIEAGSAAHFKPRTREPKNISKKESLRPVILAGIDEDSEKYQKRADDAKMHSTDRPQYQRAQSQPGLFHTITSSAPGRISSDCKFSFRFSPSTTIFTGSARSNSTRSAAARVARGWSMWVPVKSRGNKHSRRARPIGAQRTYSSFPSAESAFGAIIILPPVNLLFVKARKRLGRRSHSRPS